MSHLEESKPSYYGWLVVGVVFLAELVTFGLVYAFGVFFKALVTEFHWSRAATSGAFSAYAIIHDLLAPVTGRITDRFGPRVVVAIGGFCVGLAMFLMSYINAIWQVYFYFGVIFSFGAASIYGPMMATVSRWFTEKRGLAVGIVAAGIGAGSLIFSPLSAWLISSYSWRMAYIIVGVICWVVFIPVVRFIKQAPERSMVVETVKEPTQDFTAAEALRTSSFWMISLTWLCVAIAFWAIMINIVYLLTDMGVSLVIAGTVAGTIGGASIISRVGGGFLSDRIGRKRCLLCSIVVQLIGMILLLFCQELWMFFLFAAIFGLGMGGGAGTIPAMPADYFGLKSTASIFGFMIIFAGIGVALGPFIGGYIFDTTGSYYYMIWMGIGASALALIFASLIKAPTK